MQYTLIQNLPDMKALAVEWNELLANSASHVPFLRNEYLSTWWQTLGGGEWSQGELCVITARQADRLVGELWIGVVDHIGHKLLEAHVDAVQVFV